MIPNEQAIATITKTGYVKRLAQGTFRTQRRGGKGVAGMTKKEEDEIEHLLFAMTHDYILFFTNQGRVFKLRVWDLPEGSRQSKGQAIVNLINIEQGEKIQAVLTFKPKDKGFIATVTKKGMIKKTALEKYANIRTSGIIAINLKDKDEVVDVRLTNGQNQVFIVAKNGKCIRFSEKDARPMGRSSQGVKGINLKPGDEVVSMDIIPARLRKPKDKRRKVFRHLLVVTQHGIGKKTDVYRYPLQKRGGVGVKVSNITQKTGKVVCSRVIDEKTEKLILTSKQAQVIKLPVKNIPVLSRNTQGVILMRFRKSKAGRPADSVAALACLQKTS